MAEDERAQRSRRRLAAFLLFAGGMHFVLPKPYERLIPGWLGAPRRWVYASGVWELVSGLLLLSPRTKRAGGYAAAATLAAVFPGNVKMALDTGFRRDASSVVAWGRLPMQLPMIRWALNQTADKTG